MIKAPAALIDLLVGSLGWTPRSTMPRVTRYVEWVIEKQRGPADHGCAPPWTDARVRHHRGAAGTQPGRVRSGGGHDLPRATPSRAGWPRRKFGRDGTGTAATDVRAHPARPQGVHQ